MFLEEIKAIKSEKRDLRNFGIALSVFMLILGLWGWYRGKDTYTTFFVISAASMILGLTVPIVLKPIQKAAMTFAVIMGWFMTRLILGMLFFIVFTFIGLISRILGKKFLDLKMDRSRQSYWIHRNSRPFDTKDYERQF